MGFWSIHFPFLRRKQIKQMKRKTNPLKVSPRKRQRRSAVLREYFSVRIQNSRLLAPTWRYKNGWCWAVALIRQFEAKLKLHDHIMPKVYLSVQHLVHRVPKFLRGEDDDVRDLSCARQPLYRGVTTEEFCPVGSTVESIPNDAPRFCLSRVEIFKDFNYTPETWDKMIEERLLIDGGTPFAASVIWFASYTTAREMFKPNEAERDEYARDPYSPLRSVHTMLLTGKGIDEKGIAFFEFQDTTKGAFGNGDEGYLRFARYDPCPVIEMVHMELDMGQVTTGKASTSNGSEEERGNVVHQNSDLPKEESTGVQVIKEENMDDSLVAIDDAESEKLKRLEIWKGKRVVEDTDSDDSSYEEDEKSVVLKIGSQIVPDKDTSSGSVMVGAYDGGSSGKTLGTSVSVKNQGNDFEVKTVETEGDAESVDAAVCCKPVEPLNFDDFKSAKDMEVMGRKRLKTELQSRGHKGGGTLQERAARLFLLKSTPLDELPQSAVGCKPVEPLNFDDFKSAEDMEVMGRKRLKTELQSRGHKGGGTLQERAARLFLLKSTPLDKLPEKLLAKK